MVIGLTGGSCCGKSTAATAIRSMGIPVVDADAISHSLTNENGPAIPAIRRTFGDGVVSAFGVLNRQELRKRILSDPEQRKKLNAILHPMIREEMGHQIRQYREQGHSLIVLDVPLLFETGMNTMVDRVICMTVSREEQLRRIMERDHVSREDASRLVATQMSGEEKARVADYVVSSERPQEETAAEILSVLKTCTEEGSAIPNEDPKDLQVPLDYHFASSLKEGIAMQKDRKRRRVSAPMVGARVERISFPDHYGIPENPFARKTTVSQQPSTSQNSALRQVLSQSEDQKVNPGLTSGTSLSPASQFVAPKAPIVPEWMKQTVSPAKPAGRAVGPRVQAAAKVGGENAEKGALTGSSEGYAYAGYPEEMVMARRREEEEEARILGRKTHGADSARKSGDSIPHTTMPFLEFSENQGAPQYLWQSDMAPRPQSERTAKQVADATGDYGSEVATIPPPPPPILPYPGRVKKSHAVLKSLTAVSLVFALLCGAFVGFSVGQGSRYEQQLANIYEQRELAKQQLEAAHPLSYQELITQKANKYGIVPAFVASVVLNESSFNPLAVSSVGARGLMQFMDDTASWIWGKLQPEGEYNFDLLFTEAINVEFGCWYLDYLAGLFHGDPILVAAAFHAGQGEVKNWLNDTRYSSDGVSIALDKLPDGPTKTYVKRILRDYAVYKDRYSSEGGGVKS